MSDIVGWLRACDCSEHCKSGCIQERAAAEIERLRDDHKMLLLCESDRREMADEIERLRALLYRWLVWNGEGCEHDLADETSRALEGK